MNAELEKELKYSNAINKLILKNSIRKYMQCRHEESLDNLIIVLDHLKTFNIITSWNDSFRSYTTLKFWLSKYDLANLLNINLEHVEHLDNYFMKNNLDIERNVLERFERLRKEIDRFYGKIKKI